MKRQRRAVKPEKKKKTDMTAPDQPAPKKQDRRSFLQNLALGTGVAVVGVAGGWYVVGDVMATVQEHDLSRIGNGVPTVVQIHDPSCSRCVALQREARDAMSFFKDDELQFLVANITGAEGGRLASAHGVGNVTLLLFDGKGQRRGILAGTRSADELEVIFKGHVNRYGKRSLLN